MALAKVALVVVFIGCLLVAFEAGMLVQWRLTALQSTPGYHFDGNHNVTRPLLISHRGSRFLYAENTIEGFEVALELGAEVVEFDVRLTADKQLAVFHDASVDRTTNGTGLVREHTLAQLQQLDAGYGYTPFVAKHRWVHGPPDIPEEYLYPLRGKGLRVSTFEEVLTRFANESINIEIKDDEEIVADMLAKYVLSHPHQRVVVSCMYSGVMNRLRELTKGRLATSASDDDSIPFVISQLFHVSKLYHWLIDVTHPFAFFQLPSETDGVVLGTKQLVQAAHDLGYRVHYWVINEAEEMHHLLDCGADAIMSDRVDIGARVWAQRGWLPKHHLADNVEVPLAEGQQGGEQWNRQWKRPNGKHIFYRSDMKEASSWECKTISCHVLRVAVANPLATVTLVFVAIMCLLKVILMCRARKAKVE